MAAETAQVRRLRSDFARVRALLERAGQRLVLEDATSDPPLRYLLGYHCKSVERVEGGKAVIRDEHRVEIKLPSGYPLEPPIVRLLTPICHPHVFASGLVCLGNRWQVGEGLDNLLVRIEAILRFEPAYLDFKSPANLTAAHWAAEHLADFPLEPSATFQPLEGEVGPTERALSWNETTEG